MSMTGDQLGGQTQGGMSMQEGDDFTCPNCGCEIRLRHHGDPARMTQMRPFTCCCGTPMEPEQGGGRQA